MHVTLQSSLTHLLHSTESTDAPVFGMELTERPLCSIGKSVAESTFRVMLIVLPPGINGVAISVCSLLETSKASC